MTSIFELGENRREHLLWIIQDYLGQRWESLGAPGINRVKRVWKLRRQTLLISQLETTQNSYKEKGIRPREYLKCLQRASGSNYGSDKSYMPFPIQESVDKGETRFPPLVTHYRERSCPANTYSNWFIFRFTESNLVGHSLLSNI